MIVLADVIVPAFSMFYLGILLAPLAWVIILPSEFIVYFVRHRREITKGKLATLVVCSNILSAVCGFVISFFLPSGLVSEFIRKGAYIIQPGPDYELLILWAFPVAFVLSCIIEYRAIRPFIPPATRRKFLPSCFYANLASYTLLFALYIIALQYD